MPAERPDRTDRPERRSSHGRIETGSVLLLVPAAVLVLIILGAVTVDFSIAFLARREVTAAAASAANDAAGAAVSDAAFYGDGPTGRAGAVVIDGRRAQAIAEGAAARLEGVQGARATTSTDGASVCVVLRARVSLIFAKALPTTVVPHSLGVAGRAAAVAVRGPAGTVAPPPTCT